MHQNESVSAHHRKIHWESGSFEARAARIAAALQEVVEAICLRCRWLKSLTTGQDRLVTTGNGLVLLVYLNGNIYEKLSWYLIYKHICFHLLKLTLHEAFEHCRYDWMRDALKHFLTSLLRSKDLGRRADLAKIHMIPVSDNEEESAMMSPNYLVRPSGVQHLEKSSSNCVVRV